jgi:endonuclease/exonuclease/phosphatase family metal-dependent hydrolase
MALSLSGRLIRQWLLVCGLIPLGACFEVSQPSKPPPENRYLFCFWNVENLFDDRDDGRTQPGDREFDRWFARDPAALQLKLAHLSEALLRLNGGRGPDILAVAEVEDLRAAQLLQGALNERLRDKGTPYSHVLMKDLVAGRHIAPAILTRLPVQADRTRLHGRHQRILEGHVLVNGHDLVIIASHWTSRLTDKEGKHRAGYGNEVYGLFRAMYHSNPGVDLLVAGDFNDPPDAPSVTQHLHARPISSKGHIENEPVLWDLFADKDPAQFGTHYFAGKWMIFDQIVISPGLLEPAGWSCQPECVKTVNTLVRPNDRFRRPWRFGGEDDRFPRGYSDHFPVTVPLLVEGPS